MLVSVEQLALNVQRGGDGCAHGMKCARVVVEEAEPLEEHASQRGAEHPVDEYRPGSLRNEKEGV
jgi:hypothetical protein